MPFRLAMRSLSRSPGLFATATLLLALGIGATTALFSVVQGVLLAPLPYHEPERLVRIWSELAARNVAYFPESPTNLEDFRGQATQFEDIAGVATGGGTVRRPGGEARQVQNANATWNFLGVLGVRPILGREFTAEDGAFSTTDVPAGAQFPANAFAIPRVAIISHALWQAEFAGRPDAIGQLLDLDGASVEVIGVLPQGVRLHMGPAAGVAPDVDIWLPLRVDFASAPRNNVFLHIVGRLRPGVSVGQGRAEIEAIAERIYDENPVMRAAGARMWLMPYGDEMVADVRGTIWALLGAAAFVLLIACSNVANLLLVRAAGRARELAVRVALGAGRARLVRLMLLESAVLAALGAAGGLLLAWAILALILDAAPANVARLDAVGIDFSVLAFACGTALLTTLLAGLAPALQASRLAVAGALRDRSGSGLAGGNSLRRTLVAGEIALSFVLLIGAGLMVRSFIELHRTDPGFDAADVLTFQVNLPFQRYPDFEQRRQLFYAFQDRLAALPGVADVAAATPLPLTGQGFSGRYASVQPTGEDTAYRQANYRLVLPGYFETMRTPLLAGRHLTRDDEINERPVAIVDDVLAAASWPSEDPIGKQVWVRLNAPEPVPLEVVGVVRRQMQNNLHEAPRESIYFTAGSTGQFGVNAWVLRSALAPDALLPLVRRELAALDAELPLVRVQPMQAFVTAAMARTRFALQLIGAFGVAALLIAAVGLYAAIHFLVRQRRAEIGVRMSFGARPADIFRQFLRHGMLLAGIGIAIGLAAAVWLAHTLSGLLVNITPTDPATYVVIAMMFVAIALVASSVPALGAARVNPITVLREE
ncbi:MAG TPA: ABC transporter permease [Gammaproteobacteria bacterium]|nr:ABC transporter permease [Gammaproteobacteria bacterium]